MHPRWLVFLMQATCASTYVTHWNVHTTMWYYVYTVYTRIFDVYNDNIYSKLDHILIMCMEKWNNIHVNICNTSMHFSLASNILWHSLISEGIRGVVSSCHFLKSLVRCPGPPGGSASWERMTLCQTPNLPHATKGRGKPWLKGKEINKFIKSWLKYKV